MGVGRERVRGRGDDNMARSLIHRVNRFLTFDPATARVRRRRKRGWSAEEVRAGRGARERFGQKRAARATHLELMEVQPQDCSQISSSSVMLHTGFGVS